LPENLDSAKVTLLVISQPFKLSFNVTGVPKVCASIVGNTIKHILRINPLIIAFLLIFFR